MNNKKKRKDIIKRKIINKNYKKVTIHIKTIQYLIWKHIIFYILSSIFYNIKEGKKGGGSFNKII